MRNSEGSIRCHVICGNKRARNGVWWPGAAPAYTTVIFAVLRAVLPARAIRHVIACSSPTNSLRWPWCRLNANATFGARFATYGARIVICGSYQAPTASVAPLTLLGQIWGRIAARSMISSRSAAVYMSRNSSISSRALATDLATKSGCLRDLINRVNSCAPPTATLGGGRHGWKPARSRKRASGRRPPSATNWL